MLLISYTCVYRIWRSYRHLFIYRRYIVHVGCVYAIAYAFYYTARRWLADGLELLHLILIFMRCVCEWVDGGIRIWSANIVPWIEYINFGFSSSFSLFRFSSRVVHYTHIGVPSSASIIFIDCYNSSNFRCRKERAVSERSRAYTDVFTINLITWTYFVCSTILVHMYHHRFIFGHDDSAHNKSTSRHCVYLILWGFPPPPPSPWDRLYNRKVHFVFHYLRSEHLFSFGV